MSEITYTAEQLKQATKFYNVLARKLQQHEDKNVAALVITMLVGSLVSSGLNGLSVEETADWVEWNTNEYAKQFYALRQQYGDTIQ